MEHHNNTTKIQTAHKILKVVDKNGDPHWLLFSETRKVTTSDYTGENIVYGDELNIQLKTLGAFTWNFSSGEEVMSMRGTASGGPAATLNFSDGYIVVEDPWKGLRIGTYMMNHLVSWAKDNYPEFRPVGISLRSSQAYNETAKSIRNRFYDRFGFKFDWTSESRIEGSLRQDMKVADLATTNLWQEKIEEFSIKDGLRKIFADSELIRINAREAESKAERALKARNEVESMLDRVRTSRLGWTFAGLLIGFVVARFV